MLDESIYRNLEKHFVAYATFEGSQGLGLPISWFLKLINICDGRGKTTYDAISDLNEARGISNKQLIAISQMMVHQWLAMKLALLLF
jgi:hypothetical protein